VIGEIGGDQQDNLVILMGINEGDISVTDGVGALDQISIVFTIITFITVIVVFVIFITFTIRIEFLTWDIFFLKFSQSYSLLLRFRLPYFQDFRMLTLNSEKPVSLDHRDIVLT